MLRRAFELMTDRAGAVAELIVLENGKTLCDAKGEVAYAVEFFRTLPTGTVRERPARSVGRGAKDCRNLWTRSVTLY